MKKTEKPKQKRINFNLVIFIISFFCILIYFLTNNSSKSNNILVSNLLKAYPNYLTYYKDNKIFWFDSSAMIFDDQKVKVFDTLLEKPDLQDQLSIIYKLGAIDTPSINYDPGRIRYEPFFKKMYGNSQKEVEKNLVTIVWLPNTIKKKIRVTKINNVYKKLQAISKELDNKKYLRKYLDNPSTFYWRKISGSNNLSSHSFGIAIDINVDFSNYWQWDNKSKQKLQYKNQIPYEIVKIFEKYGFIWGGKWYHYDTMHIEYRPELINNE